MSGRVKRRCDFLVQQLAHREYPRRCPLAAGLPVRVRQQQLNRYRLDLQRGEIIAGQKCSVQTGAEQWRLRRAQFAQ